MARDGGGGSPAAERRRVALRALLSCEEASSYALPAAAEEAMRPSKGLLRGLGCTSAAASQAHAPAAAADALGSSADWRGMRRRKGKERRKARGVGGGVVSAGGMGGDVWCTPGIPFAAEASSVDCLVALHQPTVGTRRRAQAERSNREGPGAAPARRVTMREHMSSSPMNSPPHHEMPFIDAVRIPSGRNRHVNGRRHSHARLQEEMMMFRTRVLLGRMGMYDQYQDWRLDVDNMTYEELLDLEDRIGYVSTGLREDEIIQSLRMVKYSAFHPNHFSTEMDRGCSICQEEFEPNEETGKLSCSHNYHVNCIKQWLSRKNACPVCKTVVSKT
ncbi:uncharacterized protein LOC133884789 [Phragmites australis]|uniref:uncharacterized protein LOC133884789 n=1 Tax=Phragmites australis TaxID=29695 RepID=UPI002D7847F8|nr:uncharacterized protein LOC133884789 [Phragmites australis]